MKTSKFILLIAFVLSLMLSPIIAQTDFSDEIIVYIKDGIQKGKSNQIEKVVSEKLGSLFSKYNISQDKIISVFPDFKESDTIKISTEGERIKQPNMSNIYKIKLTDKNLKGTIIKDLETQPEILFAEPNGIASPMVVPNDQYFSNQWALQPGTKIQAPEAWDIYKGNPNNYIGIIDGGIDATHPDLNEKVFGDVGYGWDGHGIHVGGIAGAKTNDSLGVAGIDWNAKLLSKRVDNNDDVGKYYAVVNAVNYSPNLYVLNNSWALINDDYSPRYSTTVALAFAYAYKMNRTSVCANGNYQLWYPNQTYYPAGFGQGITAVGSTDINDERAPSSQINSVIDVSAPGVNILSTYRNGNFPDDPNYHFDGGTSMASPVVAGIASLLKGYNPNLYNDDIEQIIRISADKVAGMSGQNFTTEYGYGRVNALKALQLISSPNTIAKVYVTGGTVSNTSASFNTNLLGVPGISDGLYSVQRIEVVRDVQFPYQVGPPVLQGTTFNLPQVWGNGNATTEAQTGLSYIAETNPITCNPGTYLYGMPYTEVVPSSVTSTGCRLRTYVYKVSRVAYATYGVCYPSNYLGTFPTTAANVRFAYSILGKPPSLSASISGSTYIASGQNGTWTASPSGGYPPYTYNWYYRHPSFLPKNSSLDKPPAGYWYLLGMHTSQISRSDNQDFEIKCTVIDNTNNTANSNIIYVNVSGGYSASQTDPEEYELEQNNPNPFNPSTKISYSLKTDGRVSLKIYNTLGEEVITLVDEIKPAGSYEADFNASELPSGIYIYRMQSGEYVSSKKMLLIK